MTSSPTPEESRTTEARNTASRDLSRMSGVEIARLMSQEERGTTEAVAAVASAIGEAIELIESRMRDGGRLFYVGAGTSGRLGVLDASECPPTFGVGSDRVIGVVAGGVEALTQSREGAEDEEAGGARDLDAQRVSARDVVVGLSASGTTPYTRAAVRHAKTVGAATVGVSCNPDSPLSREAALAITPVVGPEVLTGSTRLKAGTATKLVLNMLSTGALARLGHVRGHLMWGVQPTCDKLRHRAVRIVAEATGLGLEAAGSLLRAHGDDVRRAVEAFERDAPTFVHFISPEAWDAHDASQPWVPSSLETEGFIHGSEWHQVEATAQRHFAGAQTVVLLEIDPRALGPALVREDTSGHGVFPHVYSALPPSAIVRVHRWGRDPDGVFRWPASE